MEPAGKDEKKIHEIIFTKKPEIHSAPPEANVQQAEAADTQRERPNPTAAGQLEWESPEFEFFQKTGRWYIASGAVALACIALAVSQRSFPLIVLTVIGYITVVGWSQKKPRAIQHRLGGEGLYVEERFYPYNTFAWFAIADDGTLQELVLARKSKIAPRLRMILTSDTHPDAVRRQLKGAIQENKDFEENFFDLLAKRIKF
jgi:hypothetical protein